MRHSIHKMFPLLLAASLLPVPFSPPVMAKPLQQISVDGSLKATPSINKNGSLLVPAVFLRKLGVSVQWSEGKQAVVLNKNGIVFEMTANRGDVVHKPEGTYIPLRYAVQRLGMQIKYDAGTQTAIIDTAGTQSYGNHEQDLYWLAQITEAEAGGETYEGKVAVAATILNRVDSPDWPNSIQSVIFQIVEVAGVPYYQFSPVLDGRIYEVEPEKETLRAVKDALDGVDPTGGATVFYNPAKTDNEWVRDRPVSTTIGNHVFSY